MALLDDIKTSMRISHNALDEDIQNNIDACKEDMARVGITVPEEISTADLYGKACEIYCKMEYDHQGKAEQFKQKYEALRDSLSLLGAEDV